MITPSESEEQITLFEWTALQSKAYPELKLMHHIPNGGARDAVVGAKLKAEGVKSGVPDISLPVANGEYHGLYIELKRKTGGVVSDNQKRWIAELSKQGYCAVVCRGFDEARETIMRYIKNGRKNKAVKTTAALLLTGYLVFCTPKAVSDWISLIQSWLGG